MILKGNTVAAGLVTLLEDQILGQKDLFFASVAIQKRGALPTKIQYLMSWNFMLQSVMWWRPRFFVEYGGGILDRGYLIEFGSIGLFDGLLPERMLCQLSGRIAP
jgi:hypothetical protein